MKPPSSTSGVVVAALGVLGVLTAAGAALGYQASPPPPENKRIGAFQGGTLAALGASFGGLLVGAASPKWRRVGEMTGLIGVGAITAFAALGAAQSRTTTRYQLPASAASQPAVSA